MRQRIRTFVDTHGYVVITNGRSCWKLHRVIAELNYGDIPQGYHIHHRDGNRQNNEPYNLEVLSPREHKQRHPTYKTQPRTPDGRFASVGSKHNHPANIHEGNTP